MVLLDAFSSSKRYCSKGVANEFQLALVGDVVAAGHRFMQPGFIRGLVVVHRRDENNRVDPG